MIQVPSILAALRPFLLGVVLVVMTGVASGQAKPDYVEGSVIVTFKPTSNLREAKASLKKKSMTMGKHFGSLSATRDRTTGVIKHATKTTAQLISELKADPTVETVEPDYLRYLSSVPNDTRFTDMWGLQNTGQTVNSSTGSSGDDIKFVPAWNLGRTPANTVVVGVIDSGVNYLHSDLIGNMWTNPGETSGDGLDNDSNGVADDFYGFDFLGHHGNPYDSGFHGTHVAGTIAASGFNNSGVIGVNFHTKIMAMKVSLDGLSISASAAIEAIQYAIDMKARGVNIVALNASYGGHHFSSAEKAVIQAAGEAGIVFCAAAGNDAADNDNPTAEKPDTYPANYRTANMIVVAASDQSDELAIFSNYGATKVDIAAPGTSILSTKTSVSITIGGTTYHSDPFVYTGFTAGMTGDLVDCNFGAVGDFPPEVNGKIAFIQRGPIGPNAIFFSDKVRNAIAAGATAVIIYNHSDGPIIGTLQAAGDWLPALAISKADGLAIKAGLPTTKSAVLSVTSEYEYLQGTSMAAPHVTGAIAFAAMNFPQDSVAARINRILSNADSKPGLQGKVNTGARLNLLRIVDANNNGVADWMENPVPGAPTITTAASLPGADSSAVYSTTLAATGGTGPYTWSVVNGSLPDGLTINSAGVISGIATTVGTSTFIVEATDSLNNFGDKAMTLTVVVPPLAIASAATLASGVATSDYQQSLAAAGGVLPYAWAVTAGTLPTGLNLADTGAFTGFPTASGTFNFTAEVTDGVGTKAHKDFTIVIGAAQLTITSGPNLSPGLRNISYAETLSAAGGTGALTWTSVDPLPAGLTLQSAGTISGTPSAVGTTTFVLHVADTGGHTSNRSVSLAVDALPLSITTHVELPTGILSTVYSQTLNATGGATPYTWALGVNPLPNGLTLSSGGTLTGTPGAPGNYTFSATVTDNHGRTQSRTFTLSISTAPITATSPLPLPAAVKGAPYSQTLTFSGGLPPYRYEIGAGSLPPGLRLSSTGTISGTPTVTGAGFGFTLTVSDTQSQFHYEPLQIAVSATYSKPVVNPPVFNATTVGVLVTTSVSATNYPKSFLITGLPPGLTYNATNGAIGGRPTTGGTYPVTVKATNPAGTGTAQPVNFVVNGMAPGTQGTFTGLVDRNTAANNMLGSLFTLTTTSTGYYTAKITTGVTLKSVTGYLNPVAPHVTPTLAGLPLSLTLNGTANSLSGTLGTAGVTAYRQTWSASHQATSRIGYYSMGLDLVDAPDKTEVIIPHGSGYASFTVAAAGTLSIAGRTADGASFTGGTIVGPAGEVPVYAPMYANLGTITGPLTLTDNGVTPLADNVVSGPLTWSKPKTTGRTYPDKFGPTNLAAYGKYLAIKSTGLTILGLPSFGAANLLFADGGVEASITKPNVTGFTYTPTYTVTMPATNPGKATLNINKNTGLFTGFFNLAETSPVLPRKVAFQGMIVRPASGNVKGAGYYLLPQIPVAPKTILASPILSGKVSIEQ